MTLEKPSAVRCLKCGRTWPVDTPQKACRIAREHLSYCEGEVQLEAACINCSNSPTVAKQLCASCYQRQRRGKSLDEPKRTPPGEGTQIALRCSVDQLKDWEAAADLEKKTFRDWAREALDRAAKKSREREAGRKVAAAMNGAREKAGLK